jgi:hypothetical protein
MHGFGGNSFVEVPILYIGNATAWHARDHKILCGCLTQFRERPRWGELGPQVVSLGAAAEFLNCVSRGDYPRYTLVSNTVLYPDMEHLETDTERFLRALERGSESSEVIVDPAVRATLEPVLTRIDRRFPKEREKTWSLIEELFARPVPAYNLGKEP